MSIVGFAAKNHPQQVGARGALSSGDDRGTPDEVFGPLHERFRFTIDVAASASNAKLPRFYDIEADGLSKSWAGERVWCNPPYSNLRPWVEKASTEPAEVAALLLPANRCEQPWWQDLIEPFRDRSGSIVRTEFFRGRTRFIAPDKDGIGPNERPPFGVVLVIWDRRFPWNRPIDEQA